MSFRAHIIDATALREITPMGLRAYAEAQGWRRVEDFGEHSTVYGLANAPEAIIPATAAIADYAQVISDIIALFARVEDRDELQIYRDLLTADQESSESAHPQLMMMARSNLRQAFSLCLVPTICCFQQLVLRRSRDRRIVPGVCERPLNTWIVLGLDKAKGAASL
jgi:hypothetical protein